MIKRVGFLRRKEGMSQEDLPMAASILIDDRAAARRLTGGSHGIQHRLRT